MENKKNGFPVKSTWVSIQNAEIRDIIDKEKRQSARETKPNPESMFGFSHAPKAKEYNPFDYYYNPVPDYIVIDILGDRINLQNIPLYTLFASLDPNNHEQILKFCYYFGFPRYFEPTIGNFGFKGLVSDFLCEEDFINEKRDFWHLAPLNLIQNDIIGFKSFISLTKEKSPICNVNLLPKDDVFALIKSEEQGVWYDDDLTNKDTNLNVHEAIYTILKANFFVFVDGVSFLKNVYPSLTRKKDGSYGIGWNFSNLISAMYFMLTLDLSANKIPVQCENPLCKRFFIPNKAGALYCSDTCYKRAKQQRYRAKKKDLKAGE